MGLPWVLLFVCRDREPTLPTAVVVALWAVLGLEVAMPWEEEAWVVLYVYL